MLGRGIWHGTGGVGLVGGEGVFGGLRVRDRPALDLRARREGSERGGRGVGVGGADAAHLLVVCICWGRRDSAE